LTVIYGTTHHQATMTCSPVSLVRMWAVIWKSATGVTVVNWSNSLPAMGKHLKLTDDKKAYIPFNVSLGLAEDPKKIDPVQAERWQILSPVRNHEYGTTEINRKIQAKYRGGLLMTARNPRSQVLKPFGEQEIIWTDKVMQAINCRKTSYPKSSDGLNYVANGEIGLVVQTSEGKGSRADSMKVQFSTQPLSSYYYPR